jgi:hypothetical protein
MNGLKPTVYCETNWLVALAVPHHPMHSSAKKLRMDAAKGDCVLKLPYVALLEARTPIAQLESQFNKAFAQMRDDVQRALQSGHTPFAELTIALQSEVVAEYANKNAATVVDEIAVDTHVEKLQDVPALVLQMQSLRKKVAFGGKDIVDLYHLASVLHDRANNAEGPAIFCNLNTKEFKPGGKIPEAIYRDAKILWRDDFHLETGLGQWTSHFIPDTT